MSAVPSLDSPAATLPQEQHAAGALIDLLREEQALLIGADLDRLAVVTKRKAPVITEMVDLANRRHRALAKAGHSASESGMQTWVDLKHLGRLAYPGAAAAWTALLVMAKQAQETNRINGLLINTHIARNQDALNVLQARAGGSFYGPDGQPSSRGRGRGLVIG
ncbi:MAG: flagellar protein FlgN [Burkholderiaceae bacterium]